MNKHQNAGTDLRILYALLESNFPKDSFHLFRTGSNKQTISISSMYSMPTEIARFLTKEKQYLKEENVFDRIWKINEQYFMDWNIEHDTFIIPKEFQHNY